MKISLKTPSIIQKASKSQKGLHWALEVLIFLLVYLVCVVGQSVLITPITMFCYIVEGYAKTDGTEANEFLTEFSGSNFYLIASLFVTVAMIIVVLLFCRILQNRKGDTLGFVKKGMLKEYLIGLLAGFILFSAAVVICILTGSIQFEGISASVAPGIIICFALGFMVQGMAEEVLCRGYFLVSVARRYPLIVAILFNAVAFAILHITNPGITPLAMINLTLFGIFASLYFIKRGNIWGVGAFHSVWNFVQGNFYGIPVSGINNMDTIFQTTMVEGKERMHGGAFGMEGGFAVTIVLLLGIVFFTFYRNDGSSSAIKEEGEEKI